MFVLVTKEEAYTYEWPIDVKVPDPQRPGQHHVQRFYVTFRTLPSDEARAMAEEIQALPEGEREQRQDELLHRVVTGWREVKDGAGNAVPFSVEALNAALQWVFVKAALYQGYTASLTGEGVKSQRRGN